MIRINKIVVHRYFHKNLTNLHVARPLGYLVVQINSLLRCLFGVWASSLQD